MSSKKTVLITGGAGFIGANLIRALLTQTNYQIHTIIAPNSDLWRLTDLQSDITLHEMDVSNTIAIKALVLAIKPNIIYHLAAYGGMPNELQPTLVYDVNFYGTMALLNACKEVGFDCFINTGSSSEYGIRQEAMHEDMALEPVSDYAVAKAAATHYCLKEALFNNLPIYTIRPFSVYGDYELSTRLVPTIIANALTNKPITLSNPKNVRDFIYIKDLIDGYIKLTNLRPVTAHVFNLGSGQQSTIGDVTSTIQSILDKPLNIIWGTSTPRPWEPTHWQADVHLAQKTLDWQCNHTLQQGLLSTITWFDEHLALYIDRKDYDADISANKVPQIPCSTKPNKNNATMSA